MIRKLKISFVIKLIFLFLGLIPQALQFSPLRLGGDSDGNDISIFFWSNKNFAVGLKLTFEYKRSDYTFCFRHRPVVDVS